MIDADNPVRHSVARYANDCRTINKQSGQCKGNNARLSVNAEARKGWIVATKTIHPGDEIFVSYGRRYWTVKSKASKKAEESVNKQIAAAKQVKQPMKQPVKQQARKSAQPVKQQARKTAQPQPKIYDYFRKH